MFDSLKNLFNSTGPSQKQVNDFTRAAAGGDMKTLKKFLGTHSNAVNFKNENGRTALMQAAAAGENYIVEFLLKKGATVDIKDNSGKTAFMLSKNKNIARFLARWPKMQKDHAARQRKSVRMAEREAMVNLLIKKHQRNKNQPQP